MGEKFKDVFSIPQMLFSFSRKGAEHTGGSGLSVFKTFSGNYEFKLAHSGVHPEPCCFENAKSACVIMGYPIYGDKIKPCDFIISNIMPENKIDMDFIRALDGEFLIFHLNKADGKLSIINDRFTSIPLYYFHDKAADSFYATPYFSVIWDFLGKNNKLDFNNEAFFEFLWFQRLFGSKTYSRNTFFMQDASVLELKSGSLSLERYWQRNYEKSKLPLVEHSYRMSQLMKKSVRLKAGDNKRYAHFLSGGMDSRSVLAAFDDNLPVCFTATVSENRELRTAREIAQTKGAIHIFLELDPEHYAKILSPSVRVSGGMYNYDHGLFYGYNDIVKSMADVSFHGHGFDYMFQGMYIPAKSHVFAGRTLYLRKMLEIPDDIITFFIKNASYRIKNANVWDFILPEKRKALEEFQRESLREILMSGEKYTDNPNDLWEYMTFHHLSRHYSYPNHASIATFVEQRTISFMNGLFDLYLSLPVEHRFNGRIEKQCLKLLDLRLAEIWSANTNLPVTASSLKQTVYQLAGALKRRIFPEARKPAWAERTWPTRDYALRNQQGLKDAVLELCKSDILEKPGFLDMEKVRKLFPRWIEGENIIGVSGDLVQTVLTMGTFLKQ